MLDKDQDGAINAKELKRILKQFGEPLDDDDIQEMIALAGVDAEGNVNCFGKEVIMMTSGHSKYRPFGRGIHKLPVWFFSHINISEGI